MKAVFDTNILIDYLSGYQQAIDEIARYRDPLISRITWMEVLAGADDATEEADAREFLRLFTVAEVSPEVAELTILLRREKRLRLPDAIILATAHQHGCLLVTRNAKDFHADWVEIRVPYSLKS